MNAGQLAGFVLANLCGMTIVLAAIQFATDIIPMFTGSDSFMKPGQMVMAKHVSTMRTLTGKAPTFSEKDIAEVRQQSFVSNVGAFTPSLFSVVATLGSERMGVQFSTEMFFESVPDEFMDIGSGSLAPTIFLLYCLETISTSIISALLAVRDCQPFPKTLSQW